MTLYGYARVSTKDQNLDRQLDALRRFPVPEECIVTDTATGANFDRAGYLELVQRLQEGDVLVIKSIDRLGRNYAEILEQWRLLSKQRKVDIVVLDMPLLDTRGEEAGLTREFIADILLQLLSYVAQVERDNTRQRQSEGIAAAKARGVKLGRPKKARPRHYERVKRAYDQGEINRAQASRRLGISMGTFDKWVKQDKHKHASGGGR